MQFHGKHHACSHHSQQHVKSSYPLAAAAQAGLDSLADAAIAGSPLAAPRAPQSQAAPQQEQQPPAHVETPVATARKRQRTGSASTGCYHA